jgi:hypothetical protein
MSPLEKIATTRARIQEQAVTSVETRTDVAAPRAPAPVPDWGAPEHQAILEELSAIFDGPVVTGTLADRFRWFLLSSGGQAAEWIRTTILRRRVDQFDFIRAEIGLDHPYSTLEGSLDGKSLDDVLPQVLGELEAHWWVYRPDDCSKVQVGGDRWYWNLVYRNLDGIYTVVARAIDYLVEEGHGPFSRERPPPLREARGYVSDYLLRVAKKEGPDGLKALSDRLVRS